MTSLPPPDDDVLPDGCQHHVGNMLGLVRSLLARTVAAGGAAEDMIDHFSGRLDALSRRQVARAAAPQAPVDLEELIRDELHAFRFGDDPRIALRGPDVAVSHDTAQTLGIAVHELVTNALKFGALAVREGSGRLAIEWSVDGSLLTFRWQESGIAIVMAAPPGRGFGFEYLEQAVPYELGGTSGIELRPGGLAAWLTVAAVPAA